MTKCPYCNDELEYNDDSFDHAFGVEIIKYYYCNTCDKQIDIDDVEDVE